MLIDTFHAAFEDRKEVFDCLRMHLATSPFFIVMINSFVSDKFAPRSDVARPLVSHQLALGISVLFERSPQLIGRRVVDRHGASPAATLDQGEDCHFVTVPALYPAALIREVPLRAPALLDDEGFVRLYRLALAADRAAVVFVHALADAVFKEPCRLVIDVEGAVQLVRRETLFRSRHEPEGEKPLVQRAMATVEDRAYANRELAAAVHAVVPAAALRLRWRTDRLYTVEAAADGAVGAVRPPDRLQLSPRRLVIVVAGVRQFDR